MPRTTPGRFRTVNTKAEQGGSSKQGRYLKINLNTTLAVEMIETDLSRQLRGERLTTAEVLYYMPDHPALLQRFLWQTLDLSPDYPRIHRFLDYWRRETSLRRPRKKKF